MRNHAFTFKKLFILLGLLLASLNTGSASWVVKDYEIVDSSIVSVSSSLAVCVNLSQNTGYKNVETALNKANSGEVIYVKPKVNDSLTKITISNDVTIKSGVTLSLPYKENEDGTYTAFDGDECGNELFADKDEASVNTYRQTQLIITNNATLTVYGTLDIGGVLCRKSAGVSGQTTGKYCEITVDYGSEIICDGGTINCYGYIKRYVSSENTQSTTSRAIETKIAPSITIKNKGTLLSPFVIYDYKGGHITLAVLNLTENQFCPFYVFDFCNIQVKTNIYAGSYWVARTCIYIATSKAFYPMKEENRRVNFIGTTSTNTAFVLTSGYVGIEYQPKDPLYTSDSIDSSITNIDICGTASLGGIAISLENTKYSIDTTKYFFPISYRFNFYMRKGSELNLSNKLKLLNGSKLTIDEGATLNVNSLLAIYNEEDELISENYSSPYPSNQTLKDVGLESKATLINNGTINVNYGCAIGGLLESSSNTGIINYSSKVFSVSSPEYGGSVPDSTSTTLGSAVSTTTQDKKPEAYISSNSSDYEKTTFTTNVYSSAGYNDDSNYGWNYDPTALKILNINASQNDSTTDYGSITLSLETNLESTSGYSFNWSIDKSNIADEDKENIVLSSETGESVDVYNKTTNDYEVTINVIGKDSNGHEDSFSTSVTVKKKLSVEQNFDEIEELSYTVEYTVSNETNDSGSKNGTITGASTIQFNTEQDKTTFKTASPVIYKLKLGINKPTNRSLNYVNLNFTITKGSGMNGYFGTDENNLTTYSTSNKTLTASANDTIYFKVERTSATRVNNTYLQAKFQVIYTQEDNENATKYYYPSQTTYIVMKFWLTA